MRYAWLLEFCSESCVILLSVNTVAVCRLFSLVFIDSIASRALIMASCSAWLFEHLLSSLSLICATIFLPMNIAAADPTPCPHLCMPVQLGPCSL